MYEKLQGNSLTFGELESSLSLEKGLLPSP